MKIIKKLSEHIEEEICDSEKYALMALEQKEKYPEIANTLYTLSLEELKHMQLLHGQIVKVIEEYKKTTGDPPEDMQAIYDFLHKRFINETKDVRILQNMFVER